MDLGVSASSLEQTVPAREQPESANGWTAIKWDHAVPLVLVHALALCAPIAGLTPAALIAAVASFVIRGFGITGGYHRYFSHRAFKTSRLGQFCFAVLGYSAAQGSLFGWTAIHRHHHRYTDGATDVHSPVAHGFWWSHIGWMLREMPPEIDLRTIADLRKFPELVFLERAYGLILLALIGAFLALGWFLERHAPGLHTGPIQMLLWGFAVSTTAVWHVTWSVNSLCHRFGRRRFATRDESRNNALIAILAGGEGWHNNHHRHPPSARNGFRPWEIDATYYFLLVLKRAGVIWDLRMPPRELIEVRAGDAVNG